MTDGGGTAYILGTEERRRLELLEACLDPLTTRSLDAIGVEPGWRCLELGAGAGSVARALCGRVGPSGRVTAVDLDTRFLEELGEENLDVDRRDIIAAGIPGRDYDLIHTRLLLMHLPTREKVLEEMAAALRPGGWLLVEDLDVFPLTMAEGFYAEVWNKVIAAFHAGGVASTFGRNLPALFDRAALEDVEPICHVPVFRGGSIHADVVAVSAGQMRPLLLANGATETELEEFARLVADRTQWFHLFAFYSVRGRAPGR